MTVASESADSPPLKSMIALMKRPARPLAIWQRVSAALHVANIPGLRNRLAAGAFWSLVGSVGSRSLQLFALALTAHVLGKEGFGKLAIIQSTTAMFGTLAGFGLGLTSTKYIAEFRYSDPAKAARICAMATVVGLAASAFLAAVMFLLADTLAIRALASPALATLLRISSLTLLLSAFNGVQLGELAGFEAFKAIAVVSWIGGFGSFLFLIFGVKWGGLAGATWSFAGGAALAVVLCHGAIRAVARRSSVRFDFGNCLQEKRILWTFSLPTVLSGISGGAMLWISNTVLARTNDGYAAVGMFNAANSIRMLVMYIPAIIMQASFPALARAYSHRHDSTEFGGLLLLTHNYVNVPCLLGAVILMFGANIAIKMFGAAFEGGAIVLVVLMISACIQSLGCAVGATIQARGDQWLSFWLNLLWGAVLFSVAFAAAPRMGALALAFANVLAYCTLVTAQAWSLRRDLPLPLLSALLRTSFALALAGALATVVVTKGNVSLQAVVGLAAAAGIAKAGSVRIGNTVEATETYPARAVSCL